MKPTRAQIAVLRYYAGLPSSTTHAGSRNWVASLDACKRRGWVEACEEFPFHATTEAGIAALVAVGEGPRTMMGPIDKAAILRRRPVDEL